MGTKLPQLNVAVSPDDDSWLRAEARLGIPVSALIRMAIRHLRSSILLPAPVPEEIQIGETDISPAPLPVEPPAPTRETPMTRPKSSAQAKLTRPSSSPVLNDRAACPVCEKQAGVNPETSLLGPHIAHPSVRPKGVYQACDGTGQAPAGPVIHAAEHNRRLA